MQVMSLMSFRKFEKSNVENIFNLLFLRVHTDMFGMSPLKCKNEPALVFLYTNAYISSL
jgi:hypothetical protein